MENCVYVKLENQFNIIPFAHLIHGVMRFSLFGYLMCLSRSKAKTKKQLNQAHKEC